MERGRGRVIKKMVHSGTELATENGTGNYIHENLGNSFRYVHTFWSSLEIIYFVARMVSVSADCRVRSRDFWWRKSGEEREHCGVKSKVIWEIQCMHIEIMSTTGFFPSGARPR